MNKEKRFRRKEKLTIDELPEPPTFKGVLFESNSTLYEDLPEPPVLKDYFGETLQKVSSLLGKITSVYKSNKEEIKRIAVVSMLVLTIYFLFFSIAPGNERALIYAADTNDACSPSGEGDTGETECTTYGSCNGAGWALDTSGDCNGDATCHSYGCCGDDEYEFTISRTGNTDAPTDFQTSSGDQACCDVSTDCVESGSCTAQNSVKGTIPQKAKCYGNNWYGGDNSETSCDDIVGASQWISTGTGSGNCCGDDGTGEDFESAEANGNSVCYNGNVRADGYISGSLLVSDGLFYDCEGNVDDVSGLDTQVNGGDCTSYEGYYCHTDGTWKTTKDDGCICGNDVDCTSGYCDNEPASGASYDESICFSQSQCTGGSFYCSDHNGCQVDPGADAQCDDYNESTCLTDAYCDTNCGYSTLTAPTLNDASTNTSKPVNSGLGNIRLSWTDNSGGESGFEIYRSTDNSTFTSVASNVVSPYFDDNSDDNTLYFYKISAMDSTSACYGSNSTILHNITADRTGPQTPRYGLVERDVVLYYDFEENSSSTVVDKSGFGNDGVNTGVTWSSSSGYSGGGVEFANTTNTYIDYDDVVGSVLEIEGAMTVSAWVKPTAAPEGVGRIVANSYDYDATATNRRGWIFGDVYGDTDHFVFQIHNSSGDYAQATNNSFFALNDEKWTYVVGVYNPGSSVQLYVNGKLAVQDTSDVPDHIAYAPGYPMRIGLRSDGTSSGMWNGSIDNFMIYDRALSREEVSLQYNQSVGNYTDNYVDLSWTDQDKEDGLVLYMPFEEGSGSVTRDWSDKKNDGNISGGTWTSPGKYGNALNLSGESNQGVYAPNSGSLELKGEHTISAWIKIKTCVSTVGSSNPCIVNKESDYEICITPISCKPWVAIAPNSWTSANVWDEAVSLNEWTHVAYTYDSSGNIKGYMNGILAKEYSITPTTLKKSNYTLKIGGRGTGTSSSSAQLNGTIDEVHIFNRSLSQREIINVMQSGLISKGIYKANASDGIYEPVGGFRDDFEDGDSTGWTVDSGTWAVDSFQGNYMYNQSSDSAPVETTYNNTLTDYMFEAEIYADSNSSDSTSHPGLIFNAVDGDNYDVCYFRPHSSGASNAVACRPVTSDVLGTESSSGGKVPWDTWFNVKLIHTDGTVKVYINDVFSQEYTPSKAGTDIGLFEHDGIGYFDNIKVTPLISDTNYTDTDGDTLDPEEVTSLTSSSHSVTTWSNDNTVDFNWNKALDNVQQQFYYVESYDDAGNRDTRMTHYVVNDELAAATLNVVSLVENNKICVDSTCLYLDKGETGTFAAADLEPNSRIVGTGAFSTRSSATETGAMTVPSWWKGKLFAYEATRYVQNISVYAFEDNTLIELYNASLDLKDSTTLDKNRAAILTFDFTDATGFVLNSSKPILAYHDGNSASDFFPLHPATTEWYGVGSGSMYVTCAEDGTEYDVYESDGTSTLGVTCNRGDSSNYGAAGSQGEPPSQRVVVTSGSVGVIAIGDGDGGAATTFLPKTELSYIYALPAAASYVVLSTVNQNTSCKLYEGDTLTQTIVATETGGVGYPGHVFFNTSSTFAAGSIISCDGLAHAYAEISNVETNLLGIPTSPRNPNNYPYADDYIRKINITSGLDGYEYACDTNPTLSGSSKNMDSGNVSYTCTFSSGSSNYFHLVSVDKAGNWDDTSADLGPFYIDTTAPSLGQTEVFDSMTYYNGSHYFYNGTIRIRTTFTEEDSGVSDCDYTYDNGGSWNSGSFNTTHCFSGAFTPTVDITINFNATDNAGNGASATSRTYLRDNTAPSCSINSITESSDYAYVSGNTVYYNNITTGSFNVIVDSSDTGGTGVHNVSFPALSTLTGSGQDDTETYQSSDVSAYSWSETSSYDSSASVTCYDVFAQSNTASFTVTLDKDAPSGGDVENPDDNITTTSVRVNLSSGADSDSGVASSQLYKRNATLQGISCGAYGDWGAVGSQAPADTEYDDTVTLGYCYQYQYQVFDNVKNDVNYTTSNVTIANNLPVVGTLEIMPPTTVSDINLDCNATITDAENDTFTVEYWWYNNSVLFTSGNTTDVKNNTNTVISTVSSGDTTINETWNCTIRVFDGLHKNSYSSTKKRILATFLDDPVVSPTTPGTNEDLECNFNTTNSAYNITNWYKNDISDTLLLMPFDGGSNSTYTKDYAPYIESGNVTGAVWTTQLAKHGGAYKFGGNDYICTDADDNGNCDNTVLNLTGDFTISAWINHTSGNGWVATSFGSANGGGFGMLVGSGGEVYCRTDDGTGFTDSYTSVGQVPDDTWTHVAITLSGSSCRVYVNGVDQTNTAGSHTVANSDNPFYIGARADLGGEYFNGYIDEVRIYNRSLSADEIINLRDFKYTTLDSSATTLSDDWLCDVTLNDLSSDGESKNSSAVTVANSIPFFTDNPIIGPDGANDEDTLTCNYNVTDYNGETVYNITNWYKNNKSDTLLIMPFEGGSNSTDTKDYAPYIKNGIVSGATWTTGNSVIGGAYEFGSNDYICTDQNNDDTCDNYGVLNQTDDFTISAWVNHTSGTGWVATSFGQAGGGGFGMMIGSLGEVYCRTDDGSGLTDSSTLTGTVPFNTWTHVAIALSGSSCKIYVNGTDKTNTAGTHTVAPSNYSFYIGERADLGSEDFLGYIDEVRIYNRSLSQTEIENLYNLSYDRKPSNALTEGDEWLCEVTPNDGTQDGNGENSSIITITSSNEIPVFEDDPIIGPSNPNTFQDAECYFNVSDADGEIVYNITNWYKNDISDTLLLMPFEGGSTLSYTKDYAPYIKTGKVTGATYNNGFGLVGSSYYFDGNDNICTDQNDDGTCDNYGVLNQTDDFTISAWVNHTSGTGWVATSFGSANGGGFGMMVGSDGTVYCRTDDGSGSTDSSTSSSVVSDNTWTHVAIALSGSSCKIYVDGTDETNTAGTHTIANSDNPFYIGARGDLGGEYFTGHIDEVRIYNRSLSLEEIKDLYELNYTTLDNSTTSNNDKWKCEVTLNDGNEDGESKNSTAITIANIAPVFKDNPVISPISPVDDDTLVCNYNVSDADEDTIYNITNWYLNNKSITKLLMPFEADGSNNMTDYSGNNNDGSILESGNDILWKPNGGKIGGAFNFNNGDIIQTGQQPPSQVGTVEAWVYPESYDHASPGALDILADPGTGGGDFRWYIHTSSNNLFGFFISEEYRVSTAEQPALNEWTLVTLTWNSSGTYLYFNGTYIGENTGSAVPAFSGSGLDIGGNSGSLDSEFNGTIDEVRVYNRSLSQAEIIQHFNLKYDYLNGNETKPGEEWMCGVTLADSNENGGSENSTGTRINSPPTKPTLLNPSNGNLTVHDRTPYFNWTSTDADGDTLNYTINITFSSTLDCGPDISTNASESEYTPTSDYCVDRMINWTVRAYDGTEYSEWSDEWNFTIESFISLNLTANGINFGSMNVLDEKHTDAGGGGYSPIIVENTGNILVNITRISANASLFKRVSLNTAYFQFKADDDSTEANSFNFTGSATAWTNVRNISKQNVTVIQQFNYTDANDEAEIDIRVQVPLNEPVGKKRATLYIIGERSLE